MMFVEALRPWKTVGGGIPIPVTILLEGEEEIGSPSLEPFLAANEASLEADFALISDTNMWDIDTPGVMTRLRGTYDCEITLKGPDLDLHSGLFGGSALNPINALTRILGDLHDEQGRIQLPGFSDSVNTVTVEQIKRTLGIDTLMMGLGRCFHKGTRSHAILLGKLARTQ